MGEKKIEELDLYEILGLEISATTVDIKKAYRKKALACHPDKNPNNPNAAKEFHQLSKILEILIDEAARAAYDKVLKARKEAAIRHKELDGKRRKIKEDLEERERRAANQYTEKSADQKLQDEIERLRKQGSKQVEEEMEYIKRKLREENISSKSEDWDSANHRIKIKWTAAKTDETNGGYTLEMLQRFLSKYGEIVGLIISPKKKGSALVEFKTRNAAEMAMDLEIGLPSNPLKFEWINPPPRSSTGFQKSNLVKESDFESVVMMKMRQAEERKRLIEQMMKEDQEDN